MPEDPYKYDEDPNHPDYVQRRQEMRLQEDELRLREEERRVASVQRSVILTRLINGIYFLVGALELLLILRFCLRLFGANRENTFAQFIYSLSEPFVAPFSTLFTSPATDAGATILDINLLVAMIVYALLGWLVVRLIYAIWH